MCIVSNAMDDWRDRWAPRLPEPYTYPFMPPQTIPADPIPRVTPEEIAEFREILKRAREWDKAHGLPDCETESKKIELLKLAKELGVEEQIKKVLEEK